MKDILGILLLGVGGYFVYEMLFGSQTSTPVATATTTAGSPAVAATSANTNLTVADAATLAYNSAITQAQMASVQTQVNSNLQTGQIPQITGNSVLAFMLGWGGLPAQTSRTALGETYIFDGTNWNLQTSPGLSGWGLGQVRTMVGANRRNYVRRYA